MLYAIAILLVFSLGLALWASGNSRIPSELRQSLGPDQLEVIREDLALRKQLGLMIICLGGIMTIWIAN